MEKENKINFAELENTEFLSDEMMNGIDAGGCTSCKKACQPGNQNSNVGNGNVVETKVSNQTQMELANPNPIKLESTISVSSTAG